MKDPDKKVEQFQKHNSNLYSSKQQPRHFANEGGEYIDSIGNRITEYGRKMEEAKKINYLKANSPF